VNTGNANHTKKPRHIPWWASALLAATVYCGLTYGAPTMHSANPLLQQLIEAAPFFAPILTIPLLLLSAKQLYDGAPPATPEDEDNSADRSDKI
jgi:hypothetical protein